MNPILALFAVLTFNGPGPAKAAPAIADKLQTLEEKYELYATLSRDAQDDWGNVHSMCDGLIFTSVYFLAGGYADINQYRG